MLSAVRLAALGAVLAFAGPPTRPSPAIATVRIGSRDYVRATDIAQKLGLGMRWIVPDRRLLLFGATTRVEIPRENGEDTRDISVDGLRVFLGDPAILRNGQIYVSRIDFERRLAPMIRPGAIGGPPPRPPRIVALDPGHGGWDPGMQNPRLQIMEKTYTLDVALRLRALLSREGYEVFMTRTTDRAVAPGKPDKQTDLKMRGEMANLAHADLFISIHFNASSPGDTKTRGSEVWSFAPQYQRSSSSWESHLPDDENFASPANGLDGWNAVFAHAMHRELMRNLGSADRGEKIMHLGVLRSLNCPGILIESAFLSNDAEARRVEDPAFRERIAEAMLAGIRAYSAELDALRPPAAR